MDAGGNVYVVDSTGTLYSFAPTGATRYSVNTGSGTGFFSPAIGADGTLYVGGNLGQVAGFRVGGSLPTATPGPAGPTPPPSATATAPSTPSPSATPSATATRTSTDLPTPSGPAPTFPPGPPPGTDLSHLNTANAHYLAGANGATELRLYNAPVGLPDATGWHLRDPGLRPAVPLGATPSAVTSVAASPVPVARQRAGAGLAVPTLPVATPGVPATTVALTDTGLLTVTDPLTPAALPFGLHLAPTANSPALASLTNEDGITLTLGLAAINGVAPAPVPGVVGTSGDAITYTAPVASAPADLALHPTVSGLDLRLVLHNANEGGPLALTLAPTGGAYLEPKPGGAFQVTRPVTAYGDDGTAHTILSPEYVVHAPVAHDAADAAGDPTATTPVSLTLGTTPSGVQALLLTVDSAWLHAPRRVYPVSLDLPLATAYSAIHSGLAATVNSCAPDAPAAGGEIVVGTAHGCASHGLLSFNTTPLLADTPIVSATLRLYSPDQTGPTGIRVYPNTPLTSTLPVWEPSPYLQPTWASAPAVVTGSVGVAQSASDGRWQSWDVTDLVRGWAHSPATNGGLTLESDGMPVRLASPLRAGRDAPALAPYLDIVYGPRPAAAAGNAVRPAGVTSNSLASRAYGVSGDFAGPCGDPQCGGKIGVDQVLHMGAQYIRVGVGSRCNHDQPGAAWWGNHGSNTASPNSPSSVYAVMANAYADGLTPIIVFGHNDSCAAYYTPKAWAFEAANFIDSMDPALRSQILSQPTYFEVGNEINFNDHYGFGLGANGYRYGYKGIFMAVTNALQRKLGNAPWRALTSGMIAPTADGELPCNDVTTGSPNLGTAAIAIQGAEGARSNGYPFNISPSHLGVAVHPYHYDTNDSSTYWKNYYGSNDARYGSRHYTDICSDLGDLVNTWTTAFPSFPLVFTEDNWDDHPADQNPPPPANPPSGRCSDTTGP